MINAAVTREVWNPPEMSGYELTRVEKPYAANQDVLKSKELTSGAVSCLTLSDFHKVSRAGGPR
jgi:hypothetical protein